ncbi:hypothetical protein [Vibrio alginolyticus]|uniref:hypothetical protein n=1 Tax=Vibrio alginolyticus TaxID=663 RepID=UPI0015F725B1|nr:hypothetical protein [Vibrio alginolyticus]
MSDWDYLCGVKRWANDEHAHERLINNINDEQVKSKTAYHNGQKVPQEFIDNFNSDSPVYDFEEATYVAKVCSKLIGVPFKLNRYKNGWIVNDTDLGARYDFEAEIEWKFD